MECPWCHKEMEKGYVAGSNATYWYSGEPGQGALGGSLHLSGNVFTTNASISWYCENCCRVVTEVPEQRVFSKKLIKLFRCVRGERESE